MQVNDVFTLDQAAIDELKLEGVTVGQQYRITQDPNNVEVRGSKVGSDGKPQKGRPRRFPSTVVARLLGEPVPTAPAVPAAETTESETATATATSDEERLASEKREAEARALNPTGTAGNDW